MGTHTHLLQLEEVKSSPVMQVPFHLEGIGPIPMSLKLSDSGQIPNFTDDYLELAFYILLLVQTAEQRIINV